MNNNNFLMIVLCMLLVSCNGGNENFISDPAVCSYLDVQNNSNYSLYLDFAPSYLALEPPVNLLPGDTKEIYYLCTIGEDPEYALKPSEVLEMFEVSVSVDDSDIIVYTGVVDSDWVKGVVDESNVRYILPIVDADINLQSTQ